MAYKLQTLRNTDVPASLSGLLEFIDDVHTLLYNSGILTEDHRGKYFDEYGLYISSEKKDVRLFFGNWFSLWETTGEPLCICLDWDNLKDDGLQARFEEFIAMKTDAFEKLIDFERYPTAIFKESYLTDSQDPHTMSALIKELVEHLNISYVKHSKRV